MAQRLSVLLITEPEGKIDDALGIAGRALQGGVNGIMVRRPRATAREVFGDDHATVAATLDDNSFSELPTILGLGGVNRVNVAKVAEAGGPGVAAISAFYEAEDAAETARLFRSQFTS